jgi:hypothetical protein
MMAPTVIDRLVVIASSDERARQWIADKHQDPKRCDICTDPEQLLNRRGFRYVFADLPDPRMLAIAKQRGHA